MDQASTARPGFPLIAPLADRSGLFALGHAAVFGLTLPWCFGGNALWLRPPLIALGLLSLVPLLLALLGRAAHRPSARNLLPALAPFLLLNLLGAASLLNPSYRIFTAWGEEILVRGGAIPWLPSCARPGETAQALLLADGLYLTGFNLFALVRRRTHLRMLLTLLVLNAVVLSIFGTLQKLAGAGGLYFGAVPSVNSTFFASFVYHNHWGSFALLALCATLALLWHHVRHRSPGCRDFLHSPAPLFLLAGLLIAITPPLSSSRSCTALLLLLLGGATVHAIMHLASRKGRARGGDFAPPGGATPSRWAPWIPPVLALAGLGVIGWLAMPVLAPRIHHTREQVATVAREGTLGARAILYEDTLRMALDRPLFGWGRASYPIVFRHYNSQQTDRLGSGATYADAHSDWLQCLAEHGVLGALLIALSALVPLWLLRRSLLDSLLSRWLLIGCAAILLYAWLEFPFGNPAVTLAWWTCFFSALRYPLSD